MSNYGYIKSDEMSGYAIAHHGIKGQKWGVRRYQNEDGSLTELGAKRYAKKLGPIKTPFGREMVYDNDKLNKRGLKTKKIDQDAFNKYQDKKLAAIEERKKKEAEEIKEGTKLIKKADMIDQGSILNKDPKRSKRAAITGLKAMIATGDRDVTKDNMNDWIDWFLWEDQTIGMPTVADLANQGYSSKQIKSMIAAAQNMDYRQIYNGNPPPGYFGLDEGGYGYINDEFIEACVKNRQK